MRRSEELASRIIHRWPVPATGDGASGHGWAPGSHRGRRPLPAAEATALRAVDFRAPMTRCENDGAPPLPVGQAVAATRRERRAEGEAVARSTWWISDRRKRPR